MPTIPNGFANILIPAQHVSSARSAAITFGIMNVADEPDPGSLAEDVWAPFSTTLRLALDSNVTWGPIVCTLNNGTGPVSGVGSSSQVGGSAIDAIPGNGALLVQKHSLLGGRANRGRYYIPWALQESDVDEVGVISSGTVTDHQEIQDDFRNALDAADVPMVILHAGAGTPATVSALSVQNVIGTQRRRIRS